MEAERKTCPRWGLQQKGNCFKDWLERCKRAGTDTTEFLRNVGIEFERWRYLHDDHDLAGIVVDAGFSCSSCYIGHHGRI
jgi:hypothetical protein